MNRVKLIVGLANPGSEYTNTRHNAGAWLIEMIAKRQNTLLKPDSKFFGLTATVTIKNQDIRLLVPTTYMNLSGKSVAAIANFYKIKPEEILVAHDELDLPPGVAKIKLGGGHGGHNGLKDIIKSLGNSQNFYRLRIGIGHPGSREQVVGWVLSKPSANDLSFIEQAIDEADRCLDIWFSDTLSNAQQRLHSFSAS